MVGGIWAYYLGQIYPQFAIDPLITIGMVLMVYLGGKGTLWGPLVGALLLVPAQQYLAYRLGGSELYLIAYSAVFLLVILLDAARHPAVARRSVAPAPTTPDRSGRARPRRSRPRERFARTRGAPEALRRDRGRRRLLVLRDAGDDHRPDRAERIGQDHGLQSRHRVRLRRRREDRLRRGPRAAPDARLARAPRPRPHLPAGPDLPAADARRQPRARPARTLVERRSPPGSNAPSARARRSCSTSSDWSPMPTSRPRSSRTASRSCSSSRPRSWASRSWSCSTSQRRA